MKTITQQIKNVLKVFDDMIADMKANRNVTLQLLNWY